MGVTTQILGLIVSLSILVFVHELGHYFFARIFHIRVDKFYLFFNPGISLLRMKRYEGKCHYSFLSSSVPEEWNNYPDSTEWGIGWLPLGGYCSIAGMVDETTKAGDLPEEPQSWEFRSKPAWQRLFVIVGGVLMNFITALVLYAVIAFNWGYEYIPLENAHWGTHFSETALNIGFQNGDAILSVDGEKPLDLTEFSKSLLFEEAKTVQVNRNGQIVNISIPEDFTNRVIAEKSRTPFCQLNFPFVADSICKGMAADQSGLQRGDSLVGINGTSLFSFYDFQATFAQFKDQDVLISFYREDSLMQTAAHISPEGTIGIFFVSPIHYFKSETIHFGFFESIPKGISMGFEKLSEYVKQFKYIFSKEGVTQLGGFGTIGSIFPKEWDWERFWDMTAFLGIALAFMNIIPIPGLDGGYFFFILFEMITRKKPSDKFIGYANMIGFALIILLVVWANGLDILRWLK